MSSLSIKIQIHNDSTILVGLFFDEVRRQGRSSSPSVGDGMKVREQRMVAFHEMTFEMEMAVSTVRPGTMKCW